MTEHRSFLVDRGDARRRLDHVLLARLPHAGPGAAGVSRTRVQRWIDDGRVSVDGRVAARAALRLLEGQRVEVALPSRPRRPHTAEPLPLAVLYEDAALLAVDKPAGLVVHPTRRYPDGTLVNALLWHLRDCGGEGRALHLVSRLDRGTSGVVLVAKTPAVHAAIARAMARQHVVKDYAALVYGTPRSDRDRIDLRIVRDPGTGRLATSRLDGRRCSTSIELLARSTGTRAGLSLLRCTLGTGRLHQIRVHLSGIGLPLVGDPRYGAPRWRGIADPALARACAALPRQALHAWRVRLPHPITGEPLDLRAPLPPDLAALLAAARLEVK
jgi:23S rRNA pseudouridine1911/1915/1917 synthase